MNLMEFLIQVKRDSLNTTWQEWVSTATQIASVWFAKKNKILVYPIGIIGVLLAAYIYLFIATPPLYADSILNIYYFAISLYGWYNWSLKKDSVTIYPIKFCTRVELINGFLIFILSWVIIYFLLVKVTDSNTPILDSLVSSSAITAMWWMAKRKIENWYAWIFSNIVAIPLNFYKGFMLFTLMYFIFLVLAYLGYIEWKKSCRN